MAALSPACVLHPCWGTQKWHQHHLALCAGWRRSHGLHYVEVMSFLSEMMQLHLSHQAGTQNSRYMGAKNDRPAANPTKGLCHTRSRLTWALKEG